MHRSRRVVVLWIIKTAGVRGQANEKEIRGGSRGHRWGVTLAAVGEHSLVFIPKNTTTSANGETPLSSSNTHRRKLGLW